LLACILGLAEGILDGAVDALKLGTNVAFKVGCIEGDIDSKVVGLVLGFVVRFNVGGLVGNIDVLRDGTSDGVLQVDWKSEHEFVLLSNIPLHISKEATLPHPSLPAATDCDIEYIAGPRSSAIFPSNVLSLIKGEDPSAANKAPPLPDNALLSSKILDWRLSDPSTYNAPPSPLAMLPKNLQ